MKIFFKGLDGSGKTTIMYQIKGDGLVSSVPTVGFNVETLKLTKDITVQAWDLSGGHKLQQLHKHYYDAKVKALVWVVDISDY